MKRTFISFKDPVSIIKSIEKRPELACEVAQDHLDLMEGNPRFLVSTWLLLLLAAARERLGYTPMEVATKILPAYSISRWDLFKYWLRSHISKFFKHHA